MNFRTKLTQKTYFQSEKEKSLGHTWISFWHLLMKFEKPEKSEFWKNEKKITEDIIILHMCTKNNNLLRCSSWDMEWDKKNCHSGSFFTIATPHHHQPTTTKTKILKTKNNQVMYAYLDMECNRHNFLSF